MTKEYRGRHEIIEQILQTASNKGSKGVSRTSIMYKSFPSHGQLKEYLSYLLENGLLEEFPKAVLISLAIWHDTNVLFSMDNISEIIGHLAESTNQKICR
jgi:hypothetical protein